MIELTGYITETHGEGGFTIKVTSDAVEHLSFKNIQVSKEVRVFINLIHYPSAIDDVFVITQDDGYYRDEINNARSLSKALRKGDRVKCSVYIVEKETRNGVTTYKINNNRRDIETYADFELWLHPNELYFKRLWTDTPESLKFRKKNYYTVTNQEKCKEITGSKWRDYKEKWWINKRPKIVFPIFWWIRFRTNASRLWQKYTADNKLLTISILVNIILVIVTAMLVIQQIVKP